MRIAAACTGLVVVLLGASPALAQDQDEAGRIVEAFFQNKNYAPAAATFKCPGDDALSDAVMVLLTRPRPEPETRRLVTAWGYVPECRVDQILGWSEQASRIITNGTYAASLARKVLDVDSVQGLRLLRRAAADPTVPDEGRGAYQSAVYWRLSRAEQEELYIETFREGLQVGDYRNTSLGNLLYGPDAANAAMRLLSEVLEDPHNERSSYVVGVVLGVVTTYGRERFGPQDRQRIWDLMEPHLESLPPEMRSGIESSEADLKAGPG
jgi:hypothetical protein